MLRFVLPLAVVCSTGFGSTVITTSMAESYRQEQLGLIGKLEDSLTKDKSLFTEIKDLMPKEKKPTPASPVTSIKKYIREYLDRVTSDMAELREAKRKLEDLEAFPIGKLRGVIQLEKSASFAMEASQHRDAMKNVLFDQNAWDLLKSVLRGKHAPLLAQLNEVLHTLSLTNDQELLSGRIAILGNGLRESIQHKKAMKAAEEREAERAKSEQQEKERQTLIRAAETELRRQAGLERSAKKKAEKQVALVRAKEEEERARVEKEMADKERQEQMQIEAHWESLVDEQADEMRSQWHRDAEQEDHLHFSGQNHEFQHEEDMLMAASGSDQPRMRTTTSERQGAMYDERGTSVTSPYLGHGLKARDKGPARQDLSKVDVESDDGEHSEDINYGIQSNLERINTSLDNGGTDMDMTRSREIGAALANLVVEDGWESKHDNTPQSNGSLRGSPAEGHNDSDIDSEVDESSYYLVGEKDTVFTSVYDLFGDRVVSVNDQDEGDMEWIEVFIN